MMDFFSPIFFIDQNDWLEKIPPNGSGKVQGGPLPVISRVITPRIGVTTPGYPCIRPFIGVITITSRGPPCTGFFPLIYGFGILPEIFAQMVRVKQDLFFRERFREWILYIKTLCFGKV